MTRVPPPSSDDTPRVPPVEARNYEKPVAWLLGRQLLNSFKGALIYSALGSKVDARDWMAAEVIEEFADQGRDGEFWFDYLSDTGDGMTATYSLAYLSMSDLWVRAPWSQVSELKNRADENSDGDDAVRLARGAGFEVKLPRGAFLFTGGDTAYHSADYSTLAARFQLPFRWAFADLFGAGAGASSPFCRPLLGIPANHDYYDLLDGFRRQFRAPVREEACGRLFPDRNDAQLMIPGHRRIQTTSYVALKLPFGWWMWGLDTDVGEVDERQRKFFRGIKTEDGLSVAEGAVPGKMIVATCAPTTVFGKRADGVNDKKGARAYWQVGLPRPFLREDELDKEKEDTEQERKEPRLGDDQMRLDLSGDIHLYARYWGPPSGHSPREGAKAEQPRAGNYASVVSGIGGAFHHPSQTYLDEVQEQTLYPPVEKSRRAVAKELFKPWKLMNGGGVWLVGFVAAFVSYFAATIAPSSRDAFENFLARDFDFWRTPGALLALASLVPVALSFFKHDWFFEDPDLDKTNATCKVADGARTRHWYEERPFIKNLLLAVVPVALLSALAVFALRPHRAEITPFGNSMLVLLTIVWAAWAVVLGLRYSDWLFHKTMVRKLNRWDWLMTWALAVYAVLAFAFGVWFFGQRNQMAYVLLDILFVAVASIVFFGLVGLGFSKAGENARGLAGKLAFALLGLVHALAQMVVPFVLVRRGTWLTLAVALALVALFGVVGWQLMRRDTRWPLALAGLVYAALMIFLPYLTALVLGSPASYAASSGLFPADYYDGWEGLLPAFVSGLVAVLTSCVWLGWYLAVALSFGGHNNEAGGAARIERFKEFVRVRLGRDPETGEDTLTAYVIAVDEPQKNGANLKPRLADVFTLRRKTAR